MGGNALRERMTDPILQHSSAPPAPSAIEVAAGLVFREGKLLITQRRSHDHLGGLWEFPGGKRECGESFESCLARELKEELGISVRVGEEFDAVTHAYSERTVYIRFYKCRWVQHEPRPLACQAAAWITREELGQFAFPAADARLLEKLKTAAWQ
jgi:mutator protein MutT